MDKPSDVALLLKWFRYRLIFLLAVAGGCMLFIALALLSHIDPRPAVYGAWLCLFLCLLWSVYDFLRFRQKFCRLAEVLHNLQISLKQLPEATDPVEEQYQAFIRELYDDRAVRISENQKEKSNREDYYTLWVHQIKTPIAAMRLLLQSDDLRENVFTMEQELFKIEQYAEMVLQYLRLESLSYDLILKEYSLYTLVNQSVKKYATAFIGKGLSVDLERFDLTAITDEKWMSFVIEQLLSNCIKYTAKGGLQIRLDPQSSRSLLISDTGIGIKAEDIPRIFDRGFTGYNGRMDKTSTGIGLYLCQKITERLGLKLSVSSKPGEGTCYRIDFPLPQDTLQK